MKIKQLMLTCGAALFQKTPGKLRITGLLLVSAYTLLLGFAMNAHAAKPDPILEVHSDVVIFPVDYLVDVVPPNREFCVRDRSGLPSLTCSANDINLADITLPPGAPQTCKAGDIVTTGLNFKVISTAKIRYDWAFYTTLEQGKDPLDGPGEACLIWVGEINDGSPLNSQSVNGDLCADVTKTYDAVFENQQISFICQDTDGDTQVDLDYCSVWNQSDDDLCSTNGEITDLPSPGAPSKCWCASVTVPITVLPEEPALEKTGAPVHTEADIFVGNDSFSFDLKITNNNTNTDIIITELTDSFGGMDYDIPGDIYTSPPPLILIEDQVELISAIDNDGTCLDPGPETITPGNTYTCTVTFRWKSLALTDTDGLDLVVREDKFNDFSALWTYEIGDDDPPTLETPIAVGPSLDEIIASITDVPPILTISKSADPTSIPETGETGFDLVDYTVTFGSESGWDTIYIASADLSDTLLQNGVNGTSGYLTGCSISDLDAGEEPTCTYSVNLATAYTIDAGDVYKNTVTATPTDEEGTSGDEVDAFANIDVNNVNPVVTLKKYVRAGTSSSTVISEYDDTSTSVTEFQLPDPPYASPTVTYLFVVSNDSFEPFTIDGFVDFAEGPYSLNTPSQVYDSNIADTTPVAGSCAGLIGTEVAVGSDARCTLSFKVKGDESEAVDNTAWVRVSDSDGETCTEDGCFDTDPALVEFNPAGFGIELGIGLEATIEVTVTANTGNRELVSFNPFVDWMITNGTDVPILDPSSVFDTFNVVNVDCDDATQELGPDEDYSCQFTVTPKGTYNASLGLTVIEDTLKVIARDDDGVEQTLSVTITVKAIP